MSSGTGSQFDSRFLASLAGPILIALSVSEAVNLRIWATTDPPLTYLNGFMLFCLGVVLVRLHNRWTPSWPVAITVGGWALALGGLWRMLMPDAPQGGENPGTYALIAALFGLGLFLAFKGFGTGRLENAADPSLVAADSGTAEALATPACGCGDTGPVDEADASAPVADTVPGVPSGAAR